MKKVLTNTKVRYIMKYVVKLIHTCVGVAQLDRAFGYGPKGREFESSRPRLKTKHFEETRGAFLIAFSKHKWWNTELLFEYYRKVIRIDKAAVKSNVGDSHSSI